VEQIGQSERMSSGGPTDSDTASSADSFQCDLVRAVEWRLNEWRVARLLGADEQPVGTVVRIDPRVAIRVFPDFGNHLATIRHPHYEVYDRDNRSVRRIDGPQDRHDCKATVARPDADGTWMVTIRRTPRVGWRNPDYEVFTGATHRGSLSADMRELRDLSGELIVNIRENMKGLRRSKHSYAIERTTRLREPFFSVAVIAAICQRIND
jgi:hypothetical protein